MSTTTPRSHERLYQLAMDQVAAEWGLSSIDKVGPRLWRALVMEKIAELAGSQPEQVSDAKVRLIIEGAAEYVGEVLQRAKGLPR